MPYADSEFWERYEKHVQESLFRWGRALNSLLGDDHLGRAVLDLGCGQCFTGLRFMRPVAYIGVDNDPAYPRDKWLEDHTNIHLIDRDYRSIEGIDHIIRVAQEELKVGKTGALPIFTSFFSTELTAPWEVNKQLYERLFREIPAIPWAVVSGFYYSNMIGQAVVVEEGGIKSYQTLAPLVPGESEIFSEERLAVEAPSELFGPNVVEVWRCFWRRR